MNPKTILKVAMLTSFLTTFMGSALNLSIPNLEADFQVGATLIGWVVTSYTLSVAALSVPFGKVADAAGRRKVLLSGVGLFCFFTLACAFAWNIWVLLGLRILQGISASMIFATNNAILISAHAPSERGRVLGLSTAAVYVGLSLGPVIGGFLNHHFDWHAIFYLSSAVGLVTLTLAIKGIPAGFDAEHGGASGGAKLDVPGNLLYIACIVISLYGLTNLSTMDYAWAILLSGLAVGAAFVRVELKVENPVIRISMFTGDKAFAFSNVAALLNYGSTFAISYLMSIYLQVVMGYTSQTAGLILIAQPVMQALFSPMMGKLSDRIAPYKLATAGMGCCVIGLTLFFCVGVDTSLLFIFAALILSGFGFALFSSPNSNAIMACVQPQDYSVANSILATMRTVGQSASMAVVTIVVGFTMGSQALADASPADLVGTMHIIFGIFICLSLVGVVLSMQRRKVD